MAMNDAAGPRGKLRVYLGAAPGVGKTYAMLAEAQRRRARGADVVAALVEPHGRRLTAALAEGLETVPRRTVSYRGADFTEMDLDAVLARHPQVALVDELAHTNVPGCRNVKRWEDVDELLDAGIDVVTTLNIQHLESLSDVTRQITGVEQHERLPDEVARRADQIELVDMTPEALRRRMVHGNVYPPDRIEAALTHYFRPGNLTALRELALLWVADRVEEGLQRYRTEHGIAAPWETRERIVVGIGGEPCDEKVIRRAARIAARTPGSDLLAVHVTRDDGLAADDSQALGAQRALVASLGGSFQQIPGDDVAEALLQFARAQNATQMVLGASSRGRLATLLAGKSTPTRLARRAEHIDVHLVSRNDKNGHRPATGRLLAGLGWHRTQSKRATTDAAALSRLAVTALSGHGDPPALLEEIREMFGLSAVSLLEWRRNAAGPRWYVTASAGDRPPDSPDAEVSLQVSETCTIAGRGHPLSGEEARVLASCAVPMVAGLIRRRQDEQDAHTAWQAADSRSRSALLAATGHQAREQLAMTESALAVLADPDAVLTAGQRVALAADARRAVAHVTGLLADLRDMRRLHTGALETYLRPVDLDEILAAALEDLGPGGPDIALRMPEDLPEVIADADLLTRILTSLTAEALHRSPAAVPPALDADIRPGLVEIRISDCGVQEGEPESPRFRLARDLTEAMGDTLLCTKNEDGGRTVIITLPAAAVSGARR
jgi:two-component system, OmpR family, sensor histidine kinase KdpD